MNQVRNIIASFIALTIGLVVFLLSHPPWNTPSAATVYYSVLAFLCITISVCTRARIRTDPSPAHTIFLSGTLFASIIFGGAALFYLYNQGGVVTHQFTSGIFLNLVAFAITGISMLLYVYLHLHPPREDSLFQSRVFMPVFVTVTVAFFVCMLVITRLFLHEGIFLVPGLIAGGIATISYYIAAILLFIERARMQETHEPLRLTLSFFLLGTSSLILVYILPAPTSLWLLPIMLMIMSFIYAIVATGYTYLHDICVEERIAYAISVSISVLVVGPFLALQLIEGYIFAGIIINVGAPLIVHMGGTIFAGGIAYAIYARTRNREIPFLNPLISILLFWTLAEFALFLSHLLPLYGFPSESRVPYIAGSIVTIYFLIEIIRAILKPATEIRNHYDQRKYLLHLIIFSLMIALGEIIQSFLFAAFPSIFDGTFGTALMLGLSYISLFLLLDFFLLLSSMQGGRITVEGLACGSLSIWLVITIMKANFSVWTVGFWVAEAVLGISVLVFPVILLFYYLSEYTRAETMQSNMNVYTRFVSEQIQEHHRETIDALEKMIQEAAQNDKKLESISMALQEVSLAEELLRNMFGVLQSGAFPEDALEPMDLVDAIVVAIDRLISDKTELPQIKINKERGTCYVIANSLLIDTFQKLLEGISFHIGNIRTLDVNISQEATDIIPSWHTTFAIEAITQDVTKARFLFEKYTIGEWSSIPSLAFAYRMISLYHGDISIRSFVGAATQLLIEIRIRLPSTPSL